MKKKSLIILMLILVSLSLIPLSSIKIAEVQASPSFWGDGFESGDTSGWSNSYVTPVVSGSYKQSGSYGCQVQTTSDPWGDYVDRHIPDWEGKGEWNVSYYFKVVTNIDIGDMWTIMGMRTETSDCPIQNNLERNSSMLYMVCYASATKFVEFYDISVGDWHQMEIFIVANETTTFKLDGVEKSCDSYIFGEGHALELIEWGWVWGSAGAGHEMWIDSYTLYYEAATPPSTYSVSVDHDPVDVISVSFTLNGSAHSTPYNTYLEAGTWQFNATELNKYNFHFVHWLINSTEDSNACINVTLSAATSLTICYESNDYYITIHVSASPAIPAYFQFALTNYATPYNIGTTNGSHTFLCLTFQYYPNSSYVYTFDHWTVNGSGTYGSLSITLTFSDDTNLAMVYEGTALSPPYPYIYARGALNATWYMRSDTHTIHATLGYKLLTVNTATPTFDLRTTTGTHNISYGVRVWVIDILGHTYELTSGSPVAIVTKSSTGAEMMSAYWTCPAYNAMVDSIMIKVYQRFDEEAWSLRKIFITKSDLLIRLPRSTWTFCYYVEKAVGSTNSTFAYGSYTTYNSRVTLQYYKASPWDVALARLWQRDYVKWFFTPWTYWFGDLFWAILLFACIVMAWLRTGSFKPVLGLLWILGGSGSILWALIPATALHAAVIMLAMAMAITLFRLIYR
jgi:hypothetical protein